MSPPALLRPAVVLRLATLLLLATVRPGAFDPVPRLSAQVARDTAASASAPAGEVAERADTADSSLVRVPGVPLAVPILFLGLGVAMLAAAWVVQAPNLGRVRLLLLGAAFVAVFASGGTAGLWWAGGAPGQAAAPAGSAGWGLLEVFLLGLAVLSLVFLAMFVVESRRHAVALESHWGGFGGALGGLRIPAAGLYLLAALGFGTMLTVLSVRHLDAITKAASTDAPKGRSGRPDSTAAQPGGRPAVAAPDTAADSIAAADTTAVADTTSRP